MCGYVGFVSAHCQCDNSIWFWNKCDFGQIQLCQNLIRMISVNFVVPSFSASFHEIIIRTRNSRLIFVLLTEIQSHGKQRYA
jgi:hypothetical protein